MSNYYFLSASLPTLVLGNKPALSWDNLLTLLQTHLDPSHLHQLGQVRRMIDLDNFILHWKGQPLSPYGFWSKSQLQDNLAVHERAEKPISVWLDQYSCETNRIDLIERLRMELMLHMRKKSNIVGKYYELLWKTEGALLSARMQLLDEQIDSALLAKFKTDPATASVFDSINSSSLWQEPLFAKLLPIFSLPTPMDQQRALSQWRIWVWQEFLTDSGLLSASHFSFARIVAYLLEMIEVDRFYNLDPQMGITALPQATKQWLTNQQ